MISKLFYLLQDTSTSKPPAELPRRLLMMQDYILFKNVN